MPRPTSNCLALSLAALCLLAGQGRAGPVITVTAATEDAALPGFFTTPLPQGGSATVSGYARLVNGQPYDGEGYLIGGRNLTSYNGLPFLINDRFGSGSDRITVQLSFPVYSISFDYEIFPNANMADGRGKDPSSPGWPDFTFKADGQTVLHAFAVLPGPTDQSPNSQKNKNDPYEHAPQLLASSGTFFFPDGVTKLEFIDWPPVIGVNNLQLGTSPPSHLPEPATLTAFGLCAAGAGVYALRRRKQHHGHPAAR